MITASLWVPASIILFTALTLLFFPKSFLTFLISAIAGAAIVVYLRTMALGELGDSPDFDTRQKQLKLEEEQADAILTRCTHMRMVATKLQKAVSTMMLHDKSLKYQADQVNYLLKNETDMR